MKLIEVGPNASLDAILRDLDEDVLITRQGKPVALIREFDEDDLLWYARENDPKFLDSIAKARGQVTRGEVTSHGDLKRQLGIE